MTDPEVGWTKGAVIGEIVVTNYIRFHARVTNSAIQLSLKEEAIGKAVLAKAAKDKAAKLTIKRVTEVNNEDMDCAESSMSYAEL